MEPDKRLEIYAVTYSNFLFSTYINRQEVDNEAESFVAAFLTVFMAAAAKKPVSLAHAFFPRF